MSTFALRSAEPLHLSLEPLAFFFRREKLFAAAGFAVIALVPPTLVAYALDGRTLLDVNVWEKPLKFEGALIAYLFTLALFAGWLPQGTTRKRWYRVYTGVVTAAIAVEMCWLIGAAAIGQASHFNTTMPVLKALYPVMGLIAVVLTSATAVYGWQFLRDRDSSPSSFARWDGKPLSTLPDRALDPTFRLSLGLGLILTFALTVIVAGTMSNMGSHFVGGNLSDAEAAPVMGWARDGGDLRVAHFFATHAMHFIPAFGYLAGLTLPPRLGRIAVLIFSAAFTAFVGYALAEALSGRPFLPMLV